MSSYGCYKNSSVVNKIVFKRLSILFNTIVYVIPCNLLFIKTVNRHQKMRMQTVCKNNIRVVENFRSTELHNFTKIASAEFYFYFIR